MRKFWLMLSFWISCTAQACPICSPAAQVALAQEVSNSSNLVMLVVRDGRWVSAARIKGDLENVPDEVLPEPSAANLSKGLVVLKDSTGNKWWVAGALSIEYIDWLRSVSQSERKDSMTGPEWQERLKFYLPQLEHPEPLIARMAYEEIARAPYDALRNLKPQLNAQRLLGWLKEPTLSGHAPLYTLLLGIAGGTEAQTFINGQLKASQKNSDPTNLPAMLVAYLEMKGPKGVSTLEKVYLLDHQRSIVEVRAALMAFSLQGTTDAAVPRSKVLESYRLFIRSRHVLAGYVATDLMVWEAWDLAPELISLHASGKPLYPIGAYAIYNYLASNPRSDARSAVAAWKRN